MRAGRRLWLGCRRQHRTREGLNRAVIVSSASGCASILTVPNPGRPTWARRVQRRRRGWRGVCSGMQPIELGMWISGVARIDALLKRHRLELLDALASIFGRKQVDPLEALLSFGWCRGQRRRSAFCCHVGAPQPYRILTVAMAS